MTEERLKEIENKRLELRASVREELKAKNIAFDEKLIDHILRDFPETRYRIMMPLE